MTPEPPDSADEFISIGKMDWLVSKSWRKLHAVRNADWTDENRADMAAEWGVSSPVRLACGRTAAGVWVPGMFTRMGAQRCKGCCRATGLPEGKGSPKNSRDCRIVLGLDPDDLWLTRYTLRIGLRHLRFPATGTGAITDLMKAGR